MAASLTKTQSYAASQYAAQTSGNALTVTLVVDDYLWIRQTLATTDATVTPTLTEMVVEVTASGATVDCTLEAIVVQGYNPTVLAPTSINVSPGAISLQSLEPYVLIGTPTEINCTLGAVALSGNNPQVLQGIDVFVTTGAISATGLAAGIISTTAINCTTASILVAAYSCYVENLHDVPCRFSEIPVDNRTIILGADNRLFTTPFEDRSYAIKCA